MPLIVMYILSLCLLFLLINRGKTPSVATLVIDGHSKVGTKIMFIKNWSRSGIGLLNHLSLPVGEGIHLKGNSVHTVGMQFSIDLIYLSKNGKVIGVSDNIKPNQRKLVGPKGTSSILELSAGGAKLYGISMAGILNFSAI